MAEISGVKISFMKTSISVSGQFSDRTFFATPVTERFPSLLSVVNIDSLFVLSHSSISYLHLISLFGKAVTAPSPYFHIFPQQPACRGQAEEL